MIPARYTILVDLYLSFRANPSVSDYRLENDATIETHPAKSGFLSLFRTTRNLATSSDVAAVMGRVILSGKHVALASGILAFIGESEMADLPWRVLYGMSATPMRYKWRIPPSQECRTWPKLLATDYGSASNISAGYASVLRRAMGDHAAESTWAGCLEHFSRTVESSYLEKDYSCRAALISGPTSGDDSEDEVYGNVKNGSGQFI